MVSTPELNLDFKPTFIPQTISRFLSQISTIAAPLSEKIFKLDDFISRLESEMRKIDAFKRELPICMLLVNDAIIALKEEIMVLKKSSNNEPVLEQFIPLKIFSDNPRKENGSRGGDMKNWLSSTHLWNINDQKTEKRAENDSCKSFGNPTKVFIPFMGYCRFPTTYEENEESQIPTLSLIPPGIKNSAKGSVLVSKPCDNSKLVPFSAQNDQLNVRNGGRKQRRCWSAELHRRFVNALRQLGGSQAATPKQIRELMQVNGLTNDEVKSHLQKYRLHTRRLPSSKNEICHSGSPDGPLVTGATGGTSTTGGGDSMDDREDEKSENYCWRGL